MASRADDLRTDIPHSARIYDFLLGGKDNFAADREAAARITANLPHLPVSMRSARRYNTRVVRYLTADLGIRQFLDIGTGLPTSPNLHEVSQQIAPEARVVYVDNDPLVLVHARALLTSTPEGRTAYIDADLHDPDAVFTSREFSDTIDPDKPVAVTLMAILQYVQEDEEARHIIDRLLRPLASGSVLALSTVTADTAPEQVDKGNNAYGNSGIPIRSRTKAEVEALFDGLDLVEPGVTLVSRWHPDEEAGAVDDTHVYMYGGVAIKP
ncbi:MAG TPA: SAM-dependent methyltransferase [Actinoplanes sp.]